MKSSGSLHRVRISGWKLNLLSVPLVVGLLWVFMAGTRSLPHWSDSPGWADGLWFAGGLAGFVVLHELVHGVFFHRAGEVPWKALQFGFNPRMLVFFCHCPVTVCVRDYRLATLGPLLTLGPLSVLAVLAFPVSGFAAAAAVHLAGCVGDMWIWAALRPFPGEARVQDHPVEPGCDVAV
jgi:hypothetical protein